MEIVKVDKNSELLPEIWEIYRSVFPEYERVPEKAVLSIIDTCPTATLCAYTENNTVAAMTLAFDFPEFPFIYLLFLGVSPKAQGGGIGTRVLNELKKKSGRPILLEMEVVNDPHAENPEQRQRRLRFYQRNEFKQTGLLLYSDGIPYEVMVHGTTVTQRDIDALQAKIEALFQEFC